jgi:hypothetical protein
VRSNITLQKLDLRCCGLCDLGISVLANALAVRNDSTLDLDLEDNEVNSVGVRALVEDSMGAMKTLTKFGLWETPSEVKGRQF